MVAVLTVLQVAFLYAPVLHAVFETTVLAPFYLLITLSSGLVVLVLTELLKLVLYAGRSPASVPSTAEH